MKHKHTRNLILTIIGLTIFVIYSGISMTLKERNTSADGAEDKPYIGLLQFTAHPSLDAISLGVIDTLAEHGYVGSENITLDYQNGQGNQSNLNSIATRFVSNEADVMIAIATPAALSLANASSDIPVILGAITDPQNVGLVASNEAPGGNITGVSDMTPIKQQIELIRQLQPESKTLGILYSSSEDNSILQADIAGEIAREFGFEPIKRTAASTNDVSQVTQQLAAEADAIWTPNDNVIASAFPTVLEVTHAQKLPVYPAVDMMVAQGGLATLGLNQYQIGVKTGEMVVELLEGKIDPASEPVRFADETGLVINYETAELLGIEIPESLAALAIDSKELLEEGE